MNQRRSRPLWPLLTAALIGLPLLYVASFGPAIYFMRRLRLTFKLDQFPEWLGTSFTVVYAPLHAVVSLLPGTMREWFEDYISWWHYLAF